MKTVFFMTVMMAASISLAKDHGPGDVGSVGQPTSLLAKYESTIYCTAPLNKKLDLNFESDISTNSLEEAKKMIRISSEGKIQTALGNEIISFDSKPYKAYYESEGWIDHTDSYGEAEYATAQVQSVSAVKSLEPAGRGPDSVCEPYEFSKTKYKQTITLTGVNIAAEENAKKALQPKIKSGSATLVFDCEKTIRSNNLSEACQ